MSYNGGRGTFASWESVMQNDYELASLFVERMRKDYENTVADCRKVYSLKDLDTRCICSSLFKFIPMVC